MVPLCGGLLIGAIYENSLWPTAKARYERLFYVTTDESPIIINEIESK
jgi:hypothetical protein